MSHFIQYRIQRAIIAGYTGGATHQFSPRLRDKDPIHKEHSKRVLSMTGVPFTTYWYHDITWDLETTPLSGLDADHMHMFLQSVGPGQVFTFDPYYAYGASPSSVRSVILAGDNYTPDRRARRGGGGGSDSFAFKFRLLEVP